MDGLRTTFNVTAALQIFKQQVVGGPIGGSVEGARVAGGGVVGQRLAGGFRLGREGAVSVTKVVLSPRGKSDANRIRDDQDQRCSSA